jgi:hypothetical protein
VPPAPSPRPAEDGGPLVHARLSSVTLPGVGGDDMNRRTRRSRAAMMVTVPVVLAVGGFWAVDAARGAESAKGHKKAPPRGLTAEERRRLLAYVDSDKTAGPHPLRPRLRAAHRRYLRGALDRPRPRRQPHRQRDRHAPRARRRGSAERLPGQGQGPRRARRQDVHGAADRAAATCRSCPSCRSPSRNRMERVVTRRAAGRMQHQGVQHLAWHRLARWRSQNSARHGGPVTTREIDLLEQAAAALLTAPHRRG